MAHSIAGRPLLLAHGLNDLAYGLNDPPPGWRLVHNFYPGPEHDPGRDRAFGADGFRYWITAEPNDHERRCHCGWLRGREHYGTVRVVDEA